MRTILVILLLIHGAIHTLGFAEAYGLAAVPELSGAIGRGSGLLWLAAAILLVIGAVLLRIARRWWCLPAGVGVVLSQTLIVGSWGEARFGTLANLILVVPIALSLADLRPSSLRSQYRADLRRELSRTHPPPSTITEADLARLPAQVRTYLRRVGVLGRARVRSFRADFRARMRGGPDEAWMRATAEQYEFFDPPARLFFMNARRAGVPVEVYHRYVADAATMRVRVLGLFPVVDEEGEAITQSETVTLLNDMLFLAPAALVDAPITWEVVDEGSVRATYSNAGHTVSALVRFDEAGDLVGFRSEDRYEIDSEGRRLLPWLTPVTRYGTLDGLRLPVEVEARWDAPGGAWTYGGFTMERIEPNPTGGPLASTTR